MLNHILYSIFSTNMQDLIDKTHAVHYELYRRTKLEDMGFSDGGGDKQPHSLQETYELRRQEYMKNIQGREEQMRQSFVNKVKEKEAELKQAEQEVKCLWKCYLFGISKKNTGRTQIVVHPPIIFLLGDSNSVLLLCK